jgi:diguanylate cyclase (GGDEF)-like protein
MELRDRYFTVLDALPDHIFVFSESGMYIDVYGGEDDATGFDCKLLIGRTLYEVAPLEMAKQFHTAILTSLTTNTVQIIEYKFDQQDMIELPMHIPIPQDMWFEGTIKPLPLLTDNGERTVVWMARNVTRRHYLEQQLKQLSEIDELTGIFNRRAFTTLLSDALKNYHSSHRPFSLLMLDIDRFKQINDTIGHSCGDDVIEHVVKVIQSELRDSDHLGRVGGEEFSIILQDTKLESAQLMAENIRTKLENEQCDTDNFVVQVTVSIGVTHVVKKDNDIKSILLRADKAMYDAKENGRNRVSIYSEQIDYSNRLSTQETGVIFKSA